MFLNTRSKENIQRNALALLLSPDPPKPKKNETQILNYPSKSLANLNGRSHDILSTQFVDGQILLLCISPLGKKKKLVSPTCFRVPLPFTNYKRQRNRRRTGYYRECIGDGTKLKVFLIGSLGYHGATGLLI